MADVKFTDNSPDMLEALNTAIEAALEAACQHCVTASKNIVESAGRIATGNMHGNIVHLVQGNVGYVGTNTKYAIYHEMGTGIYIAGGRNTPWAYQDSNGEWHQTRGISPIHMIKNGMAENVSQIRGIFIQYLKQV